MKRGRDPIPPGEDTRFRQRDISVGSITGQGLAIGHSNTTDFLRSGALAQKIVVRGAEQYVLRDSSGRFMSPDSLGDINAAKGTASGAGRSSAEVKEGDSDAKRDKKR